MGGRGGVDGWGGGGEEGGWRGGGGGEEERGGEERGREEGGEDLSRCVCVCREGPVEVRERGSLTNPGKPGARAHART